MLHVAGLPSPDNPDGEWWVDVGLGDAFREPLPLLAGEHVQDGFTYAIDEVRPDGWSFRHDARGSFTGCEVSMLPTDPVAVLASHAELSAPGTGQFARILVVQRRHAGGTTTIRGCLRTEVGPGGSPRPSSRRTTSGRPRWPAPGSRSTTSTTPSSATSTGGPGPRTSRGGTPRIDDMAELPSDLLSIADELYGLPLPEFTPARDARAKELKGTDLAAPVKALQQAVDRRLGGQPAGPPREPSRSSRCWPSGRRCARRRSACPATSCAS